METVVTPKLKVPFRIDAEHADYVEQDTLDELVQCIRAILATEVGTREENPLLGLQDQTFRMNGADLTAIRNAISRFEPRADAVADQTLIGLLAEVGIGVRTDGSIR